MDRGGDFFLRILPNEWNGNGSGRFFFLGLFVHDALGDFGQLLIGRAFFVTAPFETDPVTLKQSRLKGGWSYKSGAKRRAKDELTGLYVRIYSGSELIEEFAQPASLKTQEKWEGRGGDWPKEKLDERKLVPPEGYASA